MVGIKEVSMQGDGVRPSRSRAAQIAVDASGLGHRYCQRSVLLQ